MQGVTIPAAPRGASCSPGTAAGRELQMHDELLSSNVDTSLNVTLAREIIRDL